LLVEDNADDEMLALLAFRKNHVPNTVIDARDGQEAVDYVLDPGKALPAIILLDLNLPRIGGLDVLKQIRANTRTALVPVIVLTSSMQETDLLASYQLRGNSYVRKPLDLDVFIAQISSLAEYWLIFNVQPRPGDA
jgi:two-component system response regulator